MRVAVALCDQPEYEGDDNESRYSLFGWSQPKSLSEAIQSGAPALFQPMNAFESVFSLRLLPRPNQDRTIMAADIRIVEARF